MCPRHALSKHWDSVGLGAAAGDGIVVVTAALWVLHVPSPGHPPAPLCVPGPGGFPARMPLSWDITAWPPVTWMLRKPAAPSIRDPRVRLSVRTETLSIQGAEETGGKEGVGGEGQEEEAGGQEQSRRRSRRGGAAAEGSLPQGLARCSACGCRR